MKPGILHIILACLLCASCDYEYSPVEIQDHLFYMKDIHVGISVSTEKGKKNSTTIVSVHRYPEIMKSRRDSSLLFRDTPVKTYRFNSPFTIELSFPMNGQSHHYASLKKGVVTNTGFYEPVIWVNKIIASPIQKEEYSSIIISVDNNDSIDVHPSSFSEVSETNIKDIKLDYILKPEKVRFSFNDLPEEFFFGKDTLQSFFPKIRIRRNANGYIFSINGKDIRVSAKSKSPRPAFLFRNNNPNVVYSLMEAVSSDSLTVIDYGWDNSIFDAIASDHCQWTMIEVSDSKQMISIDIKEREYIVNDSVTVRFSCSKGKHALILNRSRTKADTLTWYNEYTLHPGYYYPGLDNMTTYLVSDKTMFFIYFKNDETYDIKEGSFASSDFWGLVTNPNFTSVLMYYEDSDGPVFGYKPSPDAFPIELK